MRDITKYDRFYAHYRSWADGEIDFLLVIGDAGLGKSCAYKEVMRGHQYHCLGGRQTPLHVYITLYDAPDRRIVLDDISSLLSDPHFRDMLKSLCDKDPRVLRWGSMTSKLEDRAQSFVCTSPVLIVMNELPAHDPDVDAILDRCDVIRFRPDKTEVLRRMHQLHPSEGKLIELLSLLPAMPSLRTLDKARKWRASKHLNLMEELLAECQVKPEVAQLVQIMEAFPEREWCQRFIAQTGLCDRTYRRHKEFADQLLACRPSPNGCPNVRPAPPEPLPDTSRATPASVDEVTDGSVSVTDSPSVPDRSQEARWSGSSLKIA